MDLHTENQPQLTTKRLQLRPMARADAAQAVAGLNNLAVSRWLTVVPYPYLLSNALWFIEENLAGRMRSWSIWHEDHLIGNIGNDGELGYWLAEPFWGQGFATEAARAVCAHYFETTDEPMIESGYFAGNEGSRNVLTKLGFVPTSTEIVQAAALQTKVTLQRVRLTRDAWHRLSTQAQ